jgi:hypothetical protein
MENTPSLKASIREGLIDDSAIGAYCPLWRVPRRLVGLAWLLVGSRDRRATLLGFVAGQPRSDATG